MRLRTLARLINEQFPQWHATIEEGYCNTDRKIPGTRLRHPGKGRTGNKLVIARRGAAWGERPFFEHNSAETYRCNQEAVDWFVRHGGVVPGEGNTMTEKDT